MKGRVMGILNENGELTRYYRRYKKDSRAMLKRWSSSGNLKLDISESAPSAISEKKHRDGVICIHSDNSFLSRARRDYAKRKVYSEALIKTYPSDKLKGEVMKHLQRTLDDWQMQCEVDAGDGARHNLIDFYYIENDYSEIDGKKTAANVQLVIPIKNPELTGVSTEELQRDLSSKIVRPFSLFGYDYVSYDIQECPYDVYLDGKILNWICLAVCYFEGKHVDQTFEKQRFMYHMTPSSHREKIEKQGLVAKSSSQRYEYGARIYLFNTLDFRRMLQYAEESGKVNRAGKDLENDEWMMLQVDTSKIPSLKLYADTNDASYNKVHPAAVFTYQNIPRDAITKIKVFKLSDYLK